MSRSVRSSPPKRLSDAFESSTGSGSQSALFVVNADGTGLHQLTPNGLGALHPHWSPNGRLIAFNNEVQQPGTASDQIFVVHPDGSGLTRVTNPTNGTSRSNQCGHPIAPSSCSHGSTSPTARARKTCGPPTQTAPASPRSPTPPTPSISKKQRAGEPTRPRHRSTLAPGLCAVSMRVARERLSASPADAH